MKRYSPTGPARCSPTKTASFRTTLRENTFEPLQSGDRIVGTVPALFTEVEYAPGKKHAFAPGGRLFDPAAREAVVGAGGDIKAL